MAKLWRDRENMGGDPKAPQEILDEAIVPTMIARNAEREKSKCKAVPLPDIEKGPGHVAWLLVSKFPFNEEQIDAIALMTYVAN